VPSPKLTSKRSARSTATRSTRTWWSRSTTSWDPNLEVKPVLAFTKAENEQVLFDLDKKKHTIGDFSHRYDETSWFERPKRITGVLGLKYWVRDRWMKPLQLERARKDGIYDLPQVANEIRMRREQMMVTMLHDNLVATQAPEPTDDQLHATYEKHKKVYIDKEKRRVNLIYSQREPVVRRALDEIRGGAGFVDVAVRYNENATKPEDVQTEAFTSDNEQFKEIAPKTFALEKIGDYTEPFKTQSFWVMMQLAAIEPQRQLPFDEIQSTVKEDWKNQWNEDKLNELLAEWKKSIKIDVDEAALERTRVERTDVYVPGQVASAPATAAAEGAR
jgi:parvulin-like peptidyl-prolyl isomerase